MTKFRTQTRLLPCIPPPSFTMMRSYAIIVIAMAACIRAGLACQVAGMASAPVLAIKPHLEQSGDAFTLKQASQALAG